jgi:hypothetical protein
MDVQPSLRRTARLWHHWEPSFAAIAVCAERVEDRGEDADPLVLFQRSAARGLLGVFDGVGGAGRALAGRDARGVDRTQAWLASRRARGLVEEWFAGGCHDELDELLASRIAAGGGRRSRMRGSIHREYPTTFAGLTFDVDDREVRWTVRWAGDSRCYLADRTGLQQLSVDDVHGGDALESLTQDPPMTNLVCAGRAFWINRVAGHARLPCLLICATDGFFGYVDTPAQFECLLWETLRSAQEPRHWSALLAERIQPSTGDDASLALVALGYRGFGELKRDLRERAESLAIEHAQPMSRVPAADGAALAVARAQSWARYRPAYERRLPAELWSDG